jgi:stage IV sporulation protein B
LRGKTTINVCIVCAFLIFFYQANVVANTAFNTVKSHAIIANFEQLKEKLCGIDSDNNTKINGLPEISVIPGGQSIGVLTHDKGVFVAGSYDVVNLAGEKINPANAAGLKAGDVILAVDGLEINSDSQVKNLVLKAGASGRSVSLQVKRGNRFFHTTLEPVLCKDTQDYRVGLLLKDNAAGVGTLTYYEPDSDSYGALGHVISSNNCNSKPVDLLDGKIVGASVQGLSKGKRGQPGEKIGMLQSGTNISGTITKNTKLGIFGKLLQEPLANPIYSGSIPVAALHEIQLGPAEILTVLHDDQVEKFSVEILKVYNQARQDGKGLIIRITDHKLLEETGGIIQGMSGSPIIQGGKLVGAVTHVFVNEPAKGYGVPAIWMLEEAGLYNSAGENTTKPAA